MQQLTCRTDCSVHKHGLLLWPELNVGQLPRGRSVRTFERGCGANTVGTKRAAVAVASERLRGFQQRSCIRTVLGLTPRP